MRIVPNGRESEAVSLEAFICSVGERPDICSWLCTAWLQRYSVLIKRGGEMQVANPARISRAIQVAMYN
jgi:hypothetical protein